MSYSEKEPFVTIIKNKLREAYRIRKEYVIWLLSGKPAPPPHIVKQKIIKNIARRYGLTVFIETGTYLGEMVDAVKKIFKKIYSIELSEELHKQAVVNFHKYSHIALIQGDSAKELPKILTQVNDRCLFWLDGHYSAGNTACGDKETPIVEELQHIFRHTIKNHVILIDDARCFTGMNDYPTIEKLRELLDRVAPHYSFAVDKDIIRLYPK